VTLLALPTAQAGLKQLEIKGKISAEAHAVDLGQQTDSGLMMDGDLDFKMKFSQDVSARFDLEFDNETAGTLGTDGTGNRFNIGVDQAYFKLNDFLFRNFALSIGKQNFNVSLRDNKSFSWAFHDPIAVVGTYSTRDMDIKGYYLKLEENSLGTKTGTDYESNDGDSNVMGVYTEYWLNDDSLVAGYLNYKSEDDAGSFNNLVHYGIGLDYFVGESLEIYGEVAGQSIDADGMYDGSAYQLTLGGEYAFSDYDMKPTLALEYYIQTGSDDAVWQSVVGGESAADSDSLFTEASGFKASDIRHGLGPVKKGQRGKDNGVDDPISDYSVIRINGTISPSKSTKVGLGIHFFTNEDEGVSNDDMGTEVDLYGSWRYSQDITFKGGFYFVSDANHAADTVGNTVRANGKDITGAVISSSLKF
jgi:hypothetical protein